MKRATHELHTRRAMVLRAGAAANTFCRKRQLSRISNGAAGGQTRVRRWTPALLRWAQKGARAKAGTPVRGPTVSSWVSHFHLHFHIATMLASGRVRDGAGHDRARAGIYTSWLHWATAGSGRAEPRRTVKTSGATEASRLIAAARRRGLQASRELLTFADRANAAGLFGHTRTATARRAARSGISPDASRWPSVHLEQIWSRRASRPDASRRNSPADTESFAFANRGASGYARESARTVLEGTGERIARVRRRSTFNAAIQSGGLTHERDSGAHISLAHTRSRRLFRASGVPLQNIWRTSSEEGARTASASRRLQDWAASRSVDLVWRSSADGAAASGAAPRAAMSYSEPSMNAPSTSKSPPAAAGRSRDTAVICATALDPALANRLADDVIRRIDRRARIERERRGL
jgi:hypothetical protein